MTATVLVQEQAVGTVLARDDDVVIAVRPRSWLAWDTSAFKATLAGHGSSFENADAWFRS